MTTRNTMSSMYYIVAHLYWSLLSVYWYRILLFRTVNQLTLFQSKILFWGIVLACIIIGIKLTYEKNRNYVSLITNIVFPFEIYALLTYIDYVTWQLLIGLISALVISTLYTYFVFSHNINNLRKRRSIIKARIKRCIYATKTITSFCLLLVIGSLSISCIFGHSLTVSNVKPVKNDNEEFVWTISNNIEQVCLFTKDNWEKASAKEKTSAMQVIANIECQYLGLPHELTLITRNLPENTLAAYDDRTHTINVNIAHYETSHPLEILNSICHEAYHAYQYRLCEAYDSIDDEYKGLSSVRNAKYYKEEFSNYTDGNKDFSGYYSQHCENDARSYAKDALEEYEFHIKKHLEQS